MQEKPSLESVLDHYEVSFNPSRNSQKILCPVHEEHVPSCSIDLKEQVFNCHACHVGGDSFKLIQERERCDFARALEIAQEILSADPSARKTEDKKPGLYGRKVSTRPGRRAPYRPKLYDH